MATDPKAQVYRGQEGSGLAQIIDTSGTFSFAAQQQKLRADRAERRRLEAKADAEKAAKLKAAKEKRYLASLANIDSSKLWDRDVPQFTEKYNDYLSFVKENSDALQNPTKNMDVYLQKKKMEQEMKQFASSSASAQKFYTDAQTLMFKNPDKFDELIGDDGMSKFDKWAQTGGDFNTDYNTYFEASTTSFSKLLEGTVGNIPAALPEKTEFIGKDNVKYSKTVSGEQSQEAVQNAVRQSYNTSSEFKRSADRAFQSSGGVIGGVTYNNALDYSIALSEQYRQKAGTVRGVQPLPKERKGGGLNFNFGGGGKDYISALDSNAAPNKTMGGGVVGNMDEGEGEVSDTYQYTAYMQQQIPDKIMKKFAVQGGTDVYSFDGTNTAGISEVLDLQNGIAQVALVDKDGKILSQEQETLFRNDPQNKDFEGYEYKALIVAETPSIKGEFTGDIIQSKGYYMPLQPHASSIPGANNWLKAAEAYNQKYKTTKRGVGANYNEPQT